MTGESMPKTCQSFGCRSKFPAAEVGRLLLQARTDDEFLDSPQASKDRRNARYALSMAQVTKLTNKEVERRREAAARLRGLFADVAPESSLVDELIADRRAEARAEGREGKADRRA